MNIIVTPYTVICFIVSFLAAILAVFIWQKRTRPGGKILTLLTISVGFWSGALAFEYAAIDIADKIFWSGVGYIGILSCPVFFFLLSLEYNRFDTILKYKYIVLLFVIPAITQGLVFTNHRHGLIWTGFTPTGNGDNLIIYGHGPAFWLLAVGYSYLLMAAGTIMLICSLYRHPRTYRHQAFLMIIGVLIPWAGHFIYIAGLSPVPGLELAPLFLIFSGIFFTWDLYHLGLFDLVPVARDLLIEKMPEGVIVLDEHERIIDFNPAARRLTGVEVEIKNGNSFESLFPGRQDLSSKILRGGQHSYQVTLEDDRRAFVELSTYTFPAQYSRHGGRLVIIQDVTRRHNAELKNQKANRRLRTQLDEIEAMQSSLRDQALRDPLTGLFNRRYLDETLQREFARARRENKSISLCMLDIDQFKEFNDSHGHLVGDIMLQHLGQILISHTRIGDIACRYGGEEFLIVMPDMSLKGACQKIEQMRDLFERMPVVHNGSSFTATFSCGVAVFPENGENVAEVFTAADQALYQAKSWGRNCIKLAEV